VSTGQQGFDPDDYVRDDSQRRREAAEQRMIDELRPRTQAQRRDERNSTAPLRRTSPGEISRFQQASRSSVDRLAEVVNDPAVVVDAKMMRTINDPNMVMLSTGEVARLEPRSRQFSRENLVPRKTKRKKNPKLARAMREANARGRKKNGGFKKGYDQARIARLAQKILKRMK
jgi:hypothetical protein